MSNFNPFEFVGRGSDKTQLPVATKIRKDNLNIVILERIDLIAVNETM